MRERIILAPGAKGVEITKSLAMHGVNCFNLRIMGAAQLARYGLMRSGIPVPEGFVSIREETAIIAEAMKGIEYFGKVTYSDVREVAGAVRRIRSLVSAENESECLESILSKGIFREKNSALISVYKSYIQILSDRGLVDSVDIIRKALFSCSSIDADFITLKEYPLTPLDKALLRRLSDGKYRESTLLSLFEINNNLTHIKTYKNCYGASNEVETVLADIYSGHKLDKCTVAVTDSATYGQLFFDYALLYDMPISFGCGIPIINSNPARLLILYYQWIAGGLFSGEALRTMLSDSTFDKTKLEESFPETDSEFSWDTYDSVLGSIRLTNDKYINEKRISGFVAALREEEYIINKADEKAYADIHRKRLCVPYLEIVADELALPPEEFIQKYSRIRKGAGSNSAELVMSLDLAASGVIFDELKTIRETGIEQTMEDIISNVLNLVVANTSSEEGKLYVTSIDGALSTVRENLYIAGLSAGNYPGSPKENYLLLDTDLKLFGEGAEHLTSEGNIARKRSNMFSLVELASGLNSEINVSYAGLNVSELKKDNASSLVFELFRNEHGSSATIAELEKMIEKTDYFTPAISASGLVGQAYNSGSQLIGLSRESKGGTTRVEPRLNADCSPTALESFMNCPRQYMLGRILWLSAPNDEDEFSVIPASDLGTLAHAMMEHLSDSKFGKEEFLKLCERRFDCYLSEHPPLVEHDSETERNKFLEMMEYAYETDPRREVVLKEQNISCAHESGVNIHGFLDRMEKLEDGTYLIVDYKTGRKIKQNDEDPNSWIQAVMYAYMAESMGYKVAGGEYRYLRVGRNVSFTYNDEMKQMLAANLGYFREAVASACFPIPEMAYSKNRSDGDPNPCRYCKYGKICGKAQEEGDSDDE